MPLWDSVQRSLEKASQEAARIARVQRLRTTADGLARQLNTQSNAIINKTMELYLAGQITHAEIAPLCQELENLKQQFEQVQAELRQIQTPPQQAQGPGQYPPAYPPPPAGGIPTVYSSLPDNDLSTEIAPPPPEFQSSMDYSGAMLTPPPPPDAGIPPAGAYTPAAPITGTPRCTSCGAVVQPNHAFCQNCGAPIQRIEQGYQPTVRASNTDSSTTISGSEETIRAPQPPDRLASPYQPDQNQGGT